MREAIEDLRMRARWYRNVPRSKNAMGPDKRDAKAEQAGGDARASRRSAARSETVEELGTRAQDVFGLRIEASRADGDGGIWCAPEWYGGYQWEIEAPTIRAAWYAIVGMMEVGRG